MKPFLIFVIVTASALTRAQDPKTEAPVWFEGQFVIGAVPATAKEMVTVWAVRSARDMTLCATAHVEDGGHYKVSVADRPQCTNAGNGGKSVTFVFGWRGEQVGRKQISVDLQAYGQWNQKYIVDLAQSPASTLERPDPTAPLVFRRMYGQLISGGRPAGPGVPILLRMVTLSGNASTCGETKTGADGFYVLDVLAAARCESQIRTRYEFRSNGRLIGEFEEALEADPQQVGATLVHRNNYSPASVR